MVIDGKYRLESDNIVLYDNLERWFPDLMRSDQYPSCKNKPAADETVTKSTEDTDTIPINGYSLYRIGQWYHYNQ